MAPSCNADAGSEGGEAQLVSVWAGGETPPPPQVTLVSYLSPTPGLIMAMPGAGALPSWLWR